LTQIILKKKLTTLIFVLANNCHDYKKVGICVGEILREVSRRCCST